MPTSLLLGLAALLAPDDPSLAAQIRQFLDSPPAYLEAHTQTRDRLWASPDPARDPALPWLVLVDALIEHRHAVELDWKIDPGELPFALSQLAAYESVDVELRDALAASTREETLTVLHLRDAAALLAGERRIVAVMDIDSDSYVVLLLPEQRFAEAMRLADAHGHKLRDIRSYDPNEFHEDD